MVVPVRIPSMSQIIQFNHFTVRKQNAGPDCLFYIAILEIILLCANKCALACLKHYLLSIRQQITHTHTHKHTHTQIYIYIYIYIYIIYIYIYIYVTLAVFFSFAEVFGFLSMTVQGPSKILYLLCFEYSVVLYKIILKCRIMFSFSLRLYFQ